ncbi:protein-L-isoaspartate O-methyltransferase [Hydrogenophaga sp.]|uniref:protein-L-isoaspartate O-methyltransferase family protein n=1 Tax=Hydrogenophaga sp. TaxID=1904254 RepID=UPI0025BDF6DB|nr:protein-L-isoaspartate O-methyltransferase [Hydrogenophaga sp.]
MTTPSAATAPMSLEQARFKMIEQQIRPWEVFDAQVLELLERVKREDFVPPAQRALAYADLELPLCQPIVSDQCMLAPKVQARLLQELQLQPTDKVLEIGSGSGYLTALLAHMAKRVLALEIDPDLARQARHNLQRAGIGNVDLRCADACANGFAACSAEAPFNAIVLGASVAHIPPELLALLAPGGRLVAIVGDEPVMRATVVTRSDSGAYQTTQPWDTSAPRLRNFPEPSRFQFF